MSQISVQARKTPAFACPMAKPALQRDKGGSS